MSATQNEQEPIVLDGAEFGTIEFNWSGDRYEHRWTFPNSDCELKSIESTSDENWPLSPPLQQIHSQSFADGREVIFGVGMAGRGHWSASFTLVPELRCWIVELACRCAAETPSLSSCYAFPTTCQPFAADTDLELEQPLDSAQAVFIEAIAPGTVMSVQDSHLRFSPHPSSLNAETVQWAFRVRIA